MMDTKQKKSLEHDWTDWFGEPTSYTPEQYKRVSESVAKRLTAKPGDKQAAAKPDSRKKK